MPQVRIFDTEHALGVAAANDIAHRIANKPGRFLLGCPGGRSPKPVYAALADIAVKINLDLSNLTIVMMDDYVTEGKGGFDHVSAMAHYSCRRFAREDIQAVLNNGLPANHQIPDTHIWFPDPKSPSSYDIQINAAGGIDYFLLASGAGDGHVAFNPVGSRPDSQTRIVKLADQTRADNMATFPDFPDLASVPHYGVTVGIQTIAQNSHAVGMVAWGAAKRLAFQKLSAATRYDPSWPATVWAACPNATLYADQTAAKGS